MDPTGGRWGYLGEEFFISGFGTVPYKWGPYDLLTLKKGHGGGRVRGTAFWVWLPGWVCHEGDHEIRTPSQGSAQCLAHSRCAVKGATLFLLCFQSLGTGQGPSILSPLGAHCRLWALGQRPLWPHSSHCAQPLPFRKPSFRGPLGKFLVCLRCVRRFLPEEVCLALYPPTWSGEPISPACFHGTVRLGPKLRWLPLPTQAPVLACGSWTPRGRTLLRLLCPACQAAKRRPDC